MKIRETCRLCNGPLKRSLDLGLSPIANELMSSPEESLAQDRFPLFLSTCTVCQHVQLPVVINPERLFRQYPYLSGTSPVFVEHLRLQASTLARSCELRPNDLVVEVGSNDGTLLRHFDELGYRTVGVDPARNVAELACEKGTTTIPEFFTQEIARQIRSGFGSAKLVVANNVFAHADDLGEIAEAASLLIGNSGSFVFEVGYLMDVVQKGHFDVIYHEHLSYHHLRPLLAFFGRRGMAVTDARRVDTQGGSLRITVKNAAPWVRVQDGFYSILAEEPEEGVSLEPLQRKIAQLREPIHLILGGANYMGGAAMYGAPAKAVTLCAALGIDQRHISFCVEDNSLKHGRYVPGTAIPIVPVSWLEERSPKVVFVAAWNFADDIIKRHQKPDRTWVVPLPELRCIDGV